MGFLGGLAVKNPPVNAKEEGLIPGSGKSGEGNGNPLHYSCLEIPWTEGPGGLQTMGSQRVGRNLVTKKQIKHQTIVNKTMCKCYITRLQFCKHIRKYQI